MGDNMKTELKYLTHFKYESVLDIEKMYDIIRMYLYNKQNSSAEWSIDNVLTGLIDLAENLRHLDTHSDYVVRYIKEIEEAIE